MLSGEAPSPVASVAFNTSLSNQRSNSGAAGPVRSSYSGRKQSRWRQAAVDMRESVWREERVSLAPGSPHVDVPCPPPQRGGATAGGASSSSGCRMARACARKSSYLAITGGYERTGEGHDVVRAKRARTRGGR